jgi:hypothetical protein
MRPFLVRKVLYRGNLNLSRLYMPTIDVFPCLTRHHGYSREPNIDFATHLRPHSVDLLVQDFNAISRGCPVPRVYTRPSMPWVHVRAIRAARRSYRHVFEVAGIATYSPICGDTIEVANTTKGARQEDVTACPASYGS